MIKVIYETVALCSTIRKRNKFEYNIDIRYANRGTQKSQEENKRMEETKKMYDNQIYLSRRYI